jgi:hypothetical protein
MTGVPVAFGNGLGEKPILGVGPNRLDAVSLGDIPLEAANGDRSVDAAAPAGVFAGGSANSTAHGGERIGCAGDEVSLFVPPVRDELNVAAGVGRDRAASLALDLSLPIFDSR